MKPGDLVRLRTPGWEKIFGMVVEKYNAENPAFDRMAVMWGTTGKVEIYYCDKLEVLSENR